MVKRKNPGGAPPSGDRAARLAASLRENLKRRKAQARGRTERLAENGDAGRQDRDRQTD
ncbi:MAG: hypothetical protein ACTSY1_04940 [Alphaproteobacteria bacterium]